MRRNGPNYLRWVSIALLIGAVIFFFVELIGYSRDRARLPDGLVIAGIPVGNMERTEALEFLLETYSQPVELHYEDQIILLQPAVVGFELDTDAMLAAAELARTGQDFWSGFWDYLWNRPGERIDIPLRANYSETQLKAALQDLALRYDQPATPVQPIPGSPEFSTGQAGKVMDITRAAELVNEAMLVSSNRVVNLPILASSPDRPSLSTLETLMKQIAEVAGFNGLMDVFIQDLRTGEDLHFASYQGSDLDVDPDIAFTAASIIKIGIMTSYYRYFDEPLAEEQDRWMVQMITESGNDPADWLMEEINPATGPLQVSETLSELGLESTFLAGYFRLGSDLLKVFQTPANQRADINTRPDIYNQTTPSEIGMLLADIYACAKGGGTLLAVYPQEIKPAECQKMLDMLAQNQIALLIEAGVPEGTRVAHKHGWTNSPLDTVADAGIVFSPGGDYAISIFLWNDPDMIWDPTSKLVADLARAAYNFFNPPATTAGG